MDGTQCGSFELVPPNQRAAPTPRVLVPYAILVENPSRAAARAATLEETMSQRDLDRALEAWYSEAPPRSESSWTMGMVVVLVAVLVVVVLLMLAVLWPRLF
jgi:hypothetical protein